MPALRLSRLFPATSIAMLTAVSAAEADAQRFAAIDLRGDYVFSFNGLFQGTPMVATGRFVADGNGNFLNGERTLAIGGTSLEQTFSCTYDVRANGRGTANCNVVGSTPESFSFVIFDRGRAAYFVETTPGVVAGGSVTRQK